MSIEESWFDAENPYFEPIELRSIAGYALDYVVDGVFATDLDSFFDGKLLSAADLLYPGYLQTEHWQQMRELCLERAQNSCERCDETKGLQVHHLTYERLGQERMTDLEVLCDACHKKEHNL